MSNKDLSKNQQQDDQPHADTIPVREGEELYLPRLEPYLREHIEELGEHPLEVKQFAAGHSNLTYQLRAGNWEAVLRRPPLGPVAPKAHDMGRECQILRKLHPVFPLAPKPILFSDNTDIIGSPFFIMERRHGVVLDTEFPPNLEVTEEVCRSISQSMIDTLVTLHNVDYEEAGLSEIGHPEGFMERQVNGWIGRYERSKTDEIGGVDQLKKWLVDRLPVSAAPTMIHYDYKLNNVMLAHGELSQMIGIFDWEMSTIGDPLADLGAAMSYWTQADDPDVLKYGLGKAPITILPGFMTRDEFIHSYALKSGRDVSHIHFYVTFAYFKLAVILQQIYYRWKKGQTKDPRFSKLGISVHHLIHHAREISTR
jgi:aminoglycoside phosphotransferase (APT) family kinase protein